MSKIATQDQIKLNKYYADISKSTDNDVVLQFLQDLAMG